MNKLRVGILFGGRSGEHEVSLLSAASVLKAIDKEKYEVVPIGITKDGRWLTSDDAENLLTGQACAGSAPTARRRSGNHSGRGRAGARRAGGGAAGAGAPAERTRSVSNRCGAHAAGQRSRHQRRCDFSRAAWNVRRRWNHPGPARTGRPALRRRGRSGFGRGHGQGRDEVFVHRRRNSDREARHHAAQRMGERAGEGFRSWSRAS